MLFDFMNGGLSYDASSAIANTRDHMALLMFLSAFSGVGGFAQMISAIWIGFRHRSHGVPLLCVTWFFAHDMTFFINYRHWFGASGTWMSRGAWFQMAFFMVSELVVMYQIMRYSREEVFPKMNYTQALLSLIGLQIFAIALFWWFLSLIQDPLYFISFASTSILSPLLLIPMMRARGSRKGFNRVSVSSVVLLTAGFWPWMAMVEPRYFLQPIVVLIAIGNIAISVVCVWYWFQMPVYEPLSIGTSARPNVKSACNPRRP